MVELGPVADLLADQPADDPRTDQQGDHQAGQDGQDRAEHDVPIRVEVQLIRQILAGVFQKMINHPSIPFLDVDAAGRPSRTLGPPRSIAAILAEQGRQRIDGLFQTHRS